MFTLRQTDKWWSKHYPSQPVVEEKYWLDVKMQIKWSNASIIMTSWKCCNAATNSVSLKHAAQVIHSSHVRRNQSQWHVFRTQTCCNELWTSQSL